MKHGVGKGDRVIVTVANGEKLPEFEVEYAGHEDLLLGVGEGRIVVPWVSVRSVEVVQSPIRVGDVVSTREQYEALPEGSIVAGDSTTPLLRGVDGDWYWDRPGLTAYSDAGLAEDDPRRVLRVGWTYDGEQS